MTGHRWLGGGAAVALVLFGLITHLPAADDTAAPTPSAPGVDTTAPVGTSADLLSKYNVPEHGPGLFTRILRSLGLQGSAAEQANRAYRRKDYDQALQKYAEAALDQPGSQILAYDMGDADYRQKRYDDAIAAYTKALSGRDAKLTAKAYYNLGNAHFRKGEAELQAGRQEGISDYRDALAHYKKSLELQPDNRDAKRNIEVVQARLKELLKRQQQQQQNSGAHKKPPEPDQRAQEALARALQLTQWQRYDDAKTVLENILRDDATAASFQSYLQRLDDISKILKGQKPAVPLQGDPRAQQNGTGVI